jgi:hypothetical protein
MSSSANPPQELTIHRRRPAHGPERRGAKRFQCRASRLVVLRSPETGTKAEGWALNLSETGIGLYLPYPIQSGTVVVLHLRGRGAAASVTVPARVVHAGERADGTWHVGCAFARRLDPRVVQDLL